MKILHPYLWLAAAISFGMSAITFPMLFLGEMIDVSADYDTLTGSVIRFVWIRGADLTIGTKLPEPVAQVLMCATNFCIFFFVLLLPYIVYRLAKTSFSTRWSGSSTAH